jgi:cysteine synthase
MGSSLYSWIKTGELKPEGLPSPKASARPRACPAIWWATAPLIDDAVQVTDEEALTQVFDLLVQEGICLWWFRWLECGGSDKSGTPIGPGASRGDHSM